MRPCASPPRYWGWTSSPERETKAYELNEMSWWGKWVDETVWISKNTYAFFSDAFKEEGFFNRGGFLGMEKVPKDAIQAIEGEFVKKRRKVVTILVEEGRQWDAMRAQLFARRYKVADRMVVMESVEPSESPSSSETSVDVAGSRAAHKELQEWTRTYLEAFYGDQKLSVAVNKTVRKAAGDKKTTLLIARIGGAPAGCAAVHRSAGGISGAYCIGTVPRFRGMGVAAALVKRMQEMALRERRRLVLQTLTSDRVERFYAKLGFKQAYVKSILERSAMRKEAGTRALPSGESLGVRLNREASALPLAPFVEIFAGFEKLQSVRGLFGHETEKVFAKLKVSMESPVGYLRVDGDTGDIIVNPEYLRTGDEKHLYLDVLHELTHVKQFMEGRELYDRRYTYFERPTEIEAYRVAVEEAKRIGMEKDEIIEYLRVEWVTEEEFQRFVSMML